MLLGDQIWIMKIQPQLEPPLSLILNPFEETVLAYSKENSGETGNKNHDVFKRSSFLVMENAQSNRETSSNQTRVPNLVNSLGVKTFLSQSFS